MASNFTKRKQKEKVTEVVESVKEETTPTLTVLTHKVNDIIKLDGSETYYGVEIKYNPHNGVAEVRLLDKVSRSVALGHFNNTRALNTLLKKK